MIVTVYNATTGMVDAVEDLTPEMIAGLSAKGLAYTESLCVLQCRADRQKYDAATDSFINTSTPEEQAEYEAHFLTDTE